MAGLGLSVSQSPGGLGTNRAAKLVQAGGDDDVNRAVQGVFSKFPALKPLGFEIIDSRNKASPHGGKLEFFHPDESRSPNPGKPTIELFQGVRGENLERSIFGDMLHFAPERIPQFNDLREQFRKTITPQQLAVDRQVHKLSQSRGDDRPFDQWFEISRLDAYIRGGLAPDKANEWERVFTPQQRELLKEMEGVLRRAQ